MVCPINIYSHNWIIIDNLIICCITELLRSLKHQNEISEKNYDNLYPSGSKRGILYGLGKIHEVLEVGLPTFRPIFSAIGKPRTS